MLDGLARCMRAVKADPTVAEDDCRRTWAPGGFPLGEDAARNEDTWPRVPSGRRIELADRVPRSGQDAMNRSPLSDTGLGTLLLTEGTKHRRLPQQRHREARRLARGPQDGDGRRLNEQQHPCAACPARTWYAEGQPPFPAGFFDAMLSDRAPALCRSQSLISRDAFAGPRSNERQRPVLTPRSSHAARSPIPASPLLRTHGRPRRSSARLRYRPRPTARQTAEPPKRCKPMQLRLHPATHASSCAPMSAHGKTALQHRSGPPRPEAEAVLGRGRAPGQPRRSTFRWPAPLPPASRPRRAPTLRPGGDRHRRRGSRRGLARARPAHAVPAGLAVLSPASYDPVSRRFVLGQPRSRDGSPCGGPVVAIQEYARRCRTGTTAGSRRSAPPAAAGRRAGESGPAATPVQRRRERSVRESSSSVAAQCCCSSAASPAGRTVAEDRRTRHQRLHRQIMRLRHLRLKEVDHIAARGGTEPGHEVIAVLVTAPRQRGQVESGRPSLGPLEQGSDIRRPRALVRGAR